MLIIGLAYHPGFQQIAFVDRETGELQERRLQHREEAEKFYRDLAAQGVRVRVGMEASGHARWFERLLAELNFELWMGDAAEVRSKRGRQAAYLCGDQPTEPDAPVCIDAETLPRLFAEGAVHARKDPNLADSYP
jgi:hypothetical protein